MQRSEFFEQKIAISEKLLESYKKVETSLTYLIENPEPNLSKPMQNLTTAKYEIERFEIQSAIVSQQFNIDQFKTQFDEYNGMIDQLRERMPREWEPTLRAIKKKMEQRHGNKVAIHDLASALDRADQPFVSDEEKIEFFRSILELSK